MANIKDYSKLVDLQCNVAAEDIANGFYHNPCRPKTIDYEVLKALLALAYIKGRKDESNSCFDGFVEQMEEDLKKCGQL